MELTRWIAERIADLEDGKRLAEGRKEYRLAKEINKISSVLRRELERIQRESRS